MGRRKCSNLLSSTLEASKQKQAQQQYHGYDILSQTTRRRWRNQTTSKLRLWIFICSTLILLTATIGLFLLIANQSSANANRLTSIPLDTITLKHVTNVDPKFLSQIGTGGLPSPFKRLQNFPPLLVGPNGRPEILYYGAEFCPICAAERWGVVVALSQFGSFHSLKGTTSASDDIYPNTSTITFYQSGYTSSYIDFVPIEVASRDKTLLQTPTTEEQKLIDTYDAPPYSQENNAIPFIDIGNQYLAIGANYDPSVLRANPENPSSSPLSQREIASQLSSRNTLSRDILGTANYLTAAICSSIKDKASEICSNPSIQDIEATLSNKSQP